MQCETDRAKCNRTNKVTELHDSVLESITTALLQLMKTKKLQSISVSELCLKAGVSRISFYRNFQSKDDILRQYLTRCTDAWWADFSTCAQDEFDRYFLVELLEQYTKHAELINLLYQNHMSYIVKDHIFDCCDPNPQRDDIDSYTRAVLAGALYGLVDEWIRRGMKPLPDGFQLSRIQMETSR